MPLLKQDEPTTGTGSDEAQSGEIAQSGASEAGLETEKDTAELRSQTTTTTIGESLHSSLQVPNNASTSQLDVRSSPLKAGRRTSYIPAIPSPLNPSRASSRSPSMSSTAESPDSNGVLQPIISRSSGEMPRSFSTGGIPAGRLVRPMSISMNAAQARMMRHTSAPVFSPGGPGRAETPKLLRDLGRDYSRYPSSSSRNSYSDSRPPGRTSLTESASGSPLLGNTTENPFGDSQVDFHEKFGYPDDSIGAVDPYYGGEKGFILFCHEIEEDDKFHTPQPDDDIILKPSLREYLEPRSLCSAIGGIFLILGLVCVFMVLPVLTFYTNIYIHTSPSNTTIIGTGPAWAHVNNNTYSLLNNVRSGLIDPDTPASAKTRISTFDGSKLELVFSDEFNTPNRTFYPGDDPYWTAPDIWYGATQDMEWYDPDAVTTANGTLQLRLDAFPNHNLQDRSGMLNSWNQMCFKGGVFEVSVSLAGPAGVPGLWPGVWTMGNLGRPGYKATTEGVWPYTYNSCDAGITPNQSAPDGLSHLPGQKLNSCTCKGADHPSPGTGRGAPEIDIMEASVDPNNRIGVITQSFQVAPFDVYYRPNSDFMAMPNYGTTQMNGYCGGPFQQAISATTLLNNAWYDGTQYQKYAFEYIPGTSQGKIAWFVGEEPTFILDGRAIGPNGNVAARQVSMEPMSMVLNLGFSGAWSEILMGDLRFPTMMHVDYVRVYQKKGQELVGCDPPGYPTTEYIRNHPKAYQNPNLTAWDDTGYGWPKNKLTGC